MWLNVVICFFVIKPRFGIAGSLAICFQGLHPWLFKFHGFHLWLFTLNPAGSIRLIKKNREAIKFESPCMQCMVDKCEIKNNHECG